MTDNIIIHVPGEIRGKGRPRFSSKGPSPRAYTDAKTATAENWIKIFGIQAMKGRAPLDGPLKVTIHVVVPVPTSWSGKKQAKAVAGGIHPTGKPDIDNTTKAIFDALNKIVWRDDSQIVCAAMTKRYDLCPGATIEVELIEA